MDTHLALNLANSTWYLEHKNRDVLIDAVWISNHLSTTTSELIIELSDDFVATLKRLRSVVIAVFNGESIEKDIDFLNVLLKQNITYNQINIEYGETSMTSISVSNANDRILANTVSDLFILIDKNLIGSIHRCENDDCRFYYLDKSKNQSKKYCSLRCNNVAKVRRYRTKQ